MAITKQEHIELAKVIDEVINKYTQIQIVREVHQMSQEGDTLPTDDEMPEYVQITRQAVAEILSELN